MLYRREFQVSEVTDGDTLVADVDCGFDVWRVVVFRLVGINAPEKNRKATKVAGLAAKAYLETLLSTNVEHLELISYQGPETEKYGRYLARVFIFHPDGTLTDVSRHMIEVGHAVPFMTELEDIDLDALQK